MLTLITALSSLLVCRFRSRAAWSLRSSRYVISWRFCGAGSPVARSLHRWTACSGSGSMVLQVDLFPRPEDHVAAGTTRRLARPASRASGCGKTRRRGSPRRCEHCGTGLLWSRDLSRLNVLDEAHAHIGIQVLTCKLQGLGTFRYIKFARPAGIGEDQDSLEWERWCRRAQINGRLCFPKPGFESVGRLF